jgi:NADPH:quinone reductase-like Zn-dependent oxidoreductase
VGLDFSGVVESVGAPTTRVRAGDPVYGVVLPPAGSHAEYVVAPVNALARVPRNVDLVSAAALPVVALTAWQALVRVAEVSPRERVLIHAAAGGIGHLAVQIAKARGANVIGTARAGNHDFLRGLGADELIDYTTTDFAEAAADMDIVLDPISDDYGPRSLNTLKPGGLLLDVRGTGPDRSLVRKQAAERGLRYLEFGFTASGEDLDHITGLVERGDLTITIEQILPLEEAARAHSLSETGRVRGKLVLAADLIGKING